MTHLELLNVILTWRFRQPGWPRVLVDCDYLVNGVGVGLALSGGARRVVPDVLASCSARDRTLLIEVKSGHNIETDQLERMLLVTPADLRDLNHLTVGDLDQHRVVLLYACNEADADAIAASLAGTPAAVVGFDGHRFRLRGRLEDAPLEQALAIAEVGANAIPASIVPFDHESDAAAIARVIVPEIVGALVRGAGSISAEGILHATHKLVYDVMRPTGAKSELAQLRDRVSQVVNDAARNEFKDWLERPTSDQSWRFKKALTSDSAGKTRELKALLKALQTLLERLGSPEPDKLQLALFADDP